MSEGPSKTCLSCRKERPLSDFSPSGSGHRSRCKSCRAAEERKRRECPKYREAQCAQKRRWYRENRELARGRQYLSRYGITWEEALALLKGQKYKCAVCSTKLTPKNRALDHRHDTGAVAGWTCSKCNSALGLLGDGHDLPRLESLLEYARRTRHN